MLHCQPLEAVESNVSNKLLCGGCLLLGFGESGALYVRLHLEPWVKQLASPGRDWNHVLSNLVTAKWDLLLLSLCLLAESVQHGSGRPLDVARVTRCQCVLKSLKSIDSSDKDTRSCTDTLCAQTLGDVINWSRTSYIVPHIICITSVF